MNKRSLLSALIVILVAASTYGRAQSRRAESSPQKSEQKLTSPSAFDYTKPVLDEIKDIEDRVVAVAADFPDELYEGYRPKDDPEVRTAAQILLHIAEQNYSAASFIRTKAQQEALMAAGKVPDRKQTQTFVSKQDTVQKVKASFAAVREAIESNPDPANAKYWLYVISHGNGHFGNLVTYYRVNGLVPPTSR